MSDYAENVRIHTMEIMWSPSKVTDVTINHRITKYADEIMKMLLAEGAKNATVSDSLSVGLPGPGIEELGDRVSEELLADAIHSAVTAAGFGERLEPGDCEKSAAEIYEQLSALGIGLHGKET